MLRLDWLLLRLRLQLKRFLIENGLIFTHWRAHARDGIPACDAIRAVGDSENSLLVIIRQVTDLEAA